MHNLDVCEKYFTVYILRTNKKEFVSLLILTNSILDNYVDYINTLSEVDYILDEKFTITNTFDDFVSIFYRPQKMKNFVLEKYTLYDNKEDLLYLYNILSGKCPNNVENSFKTFNSIFMHELNLTNTDIANKTAFYSTKSFLEYTEICKKYDII